MTDETSQLILVRDLDDALDCRRQHARLALRGIERRVAHGAYLPAAGWRALSERQRYLARVRAVAQTRHRRPVLSHWSAAAVHRLPSLHGWPQAVHVTVGPTSGGRSAGGVVKHSLTLADADVVEVDGLLVTSIARTVLDIATSSDFAGAVMVADRALLVDRRGEHPVLATREQLWDAYARRMPFRGNARARAVIEFGVDRADSPLESISRVNMRAIGCPGPLLQERFSDYRGVIGETDFHWPDHGMVGEADGKVKYLDPRYRDGRTPEQVVYDEKLREDRLRAISLTVTRWGWDIGAHPEALRRHLAAAGLPMGR